MQWTKKRTTSVGTYYEKRGRWHGLPYVVRTRSTKGITPAGWAIVVGAALLLIVVILLEEFVI
jgi:hypothetical protein